MLIIVRLNVENIIVLGASNPILPRIILEDTRFNDFNSLLMKNILFKRIDLDLEWKSDDPSQSAALVQLRDENSRQAQTILE
jgi:hypothetical protein